ncbi:hypothetical protein MNBD_NITROSPIRAE02-128 [hydrothermal vent metagenome]|uniref:Uncharacterized protein n=1 Tax=hydrothermal vent metagenome TaxID=652676 RepID=A0A3B1DT78_9ZZZZ
MEEAEAIILASELKEDLVLLDEMINRADFWISKNLYSAVLKDNREL